MKKLLGILVFTLLFISIDLIKPTKVEACHHLGLTAWSDHSTFQKMKCKIKYAARDLNPANYFKNKKKCQAYADRADTVAIGKRRYKDCMEYPSDH